jgi:hypothetical protein
VLLVVVRQILLQRQMDSLAQKIQVAVAVVLDHITIVALVVLVL